MRIRLWREVRGDFPIGHHIVAEPRIYEDHEVIVNRHGAVCVRTPRGLLGVKPGEFEPVIDWPLEMKGGGAHAAVALTKDPPPNITTGE